MNVLSLFDGMSCGQIALERSSIQVDTYYAAEIKPHAIQVTKDNYPNTVHLGDVRGIKVSALKPIDLVIGGSPCQDFSRGNAVRDGLEGEKSSLFFEYVRILNEAKELNPDVKFLLENVVMEISDSMFISMQLGVEPIRINSDLVSGQMRDRLYWTNIHGDGGLFGNMIELPEDKGIELKDVITSGYTNRKKSRCLLESDSRPLADPTKMWHRYNNTGFTTIVFDDPSLDWEKGIRYLNQTELERLQTVPEGYTKSLKRNQAACVLGDGWTIDVITHIFKGLKSYEKKEGHRT